MNNCQRNVEVKSIAKQQTVFTYELNQSITAHLERITCLQTINILKTIPDFDKSVNFAATSARPVTSRLPDSSAGGESPTAAGVSIVEYYQAGLRKVEVLHMFVK